MKVIRLATGFFYQTSNAWIAFLTQKSLKRMELRAGEAAVEEEEEVAAAKASLPLLQLFSLLWICGRQVILVLSNRLPLSVAESEFRCTAVFSVGTADSKRR